MHDIRNAIIKAVSFDLDHGLLSLRLTLDYGDAQQAFGGYQLYCPAHDKHDRCGWFIWRVLETLEVGDWNDLMGTTVRAECEHAKVHAIGHVLKDQWFHPSDEWPERAESPQKG